MLSSSKLIRLPDPVGKFIDALNECPSLDCEPYPDCPDPDCNDMELWEMAVESLRNRILADEDWAMCDLVLDLPPEESNKIKRSMGTNGKYFTDVASLASDDDAHESWKNIIQRITGKRPTIPLRYDDSEPF